MIKKIRKKEEKKWKESFQLVPKDIIQNEPESSGETNDAFVDETDDIIESSAPCSYLLHVLEP